MNQTELANVAGVSPKVISTIKKSLGIKSKKMSKREQQRVLKKALESSEHKNFQQKVLKTKMATPKISVREIDKKNGSSLADMLQDCKEQYVRNERTIAILSNELEKVDKMFVGNANGTFQAMPQLSTIEKYQKLNIALRNQIQEFEEKLGRIIKDDEEDPFS